MCVICERVGMRVVTVNFKEDHIPQKEREQITRAIEEIYHDSGVSAVVIDSGSALNTRRYCPAYRDADGSPAIIHRAHCTGAFGIHACPYYDGSKRLFSEQCTYKRKGETS